jgi:hypothetical protein
MISDSFMSDSDKSFAPQTSSVSDSMAQMQDTMKDSAHGEVSLSSETDVKRTNPIPLPHDRPASRVMPVDLTLRLFGDGVLSEIERDSVLSLWSANRRLEAVNTLMTAWVQADDRGLRVSSSLRTFTPDHPTLKPSSFRLDNFDAMLMDEQPRTRSFLVDGFQNGFSLFRSDPDWQQVIYANGTLSDTAARLLQEGIDEDLRRGFICPRDPADGK